MPANVVRTPKEEKLWEKAKEIAESQGQAENYPYIMGIFKRMNPKRFPTSTWIRALACQIRTHTDTSLC